MQGPGKYDAWCTQVREGTRAEGVVLLVLNGERGSGFSVQASAPLTQAVLADLLEHVTGALRLQARAGLSVIDFGEMSGPSADGAPGPSAIAANQSFHGNEPDKEPHD
jgi:hypothetical protein